MRHDQTLREIDACLEAGVSLPPELAARLSAQPQLRRQTQSLRRVDDLLRSELGRAAECPTPGLSARVLARLPSQRPRRRALPWTGLAALAAAALLWLGLQGARHEAAPTALPSLFDPANRSADDLGVPLARWLDWRVPLAPERALLEEAELLASDTRRTAASLWSRLPLTSLLARDGG